MATQASDLTDIERVISLDALKWAWLRVRENRGAAGGDGISLNRFERMLEANLIELADEVRAGSYRPSPVRTVSIHRPRKSRRIAILAVRDRVLQRAVLEFIDDHCDRQFLQCSYGYRRGRSLHNAVERIVHLRDRGHTTIVDADILNCFGSLNHDVLQRVIDSMLPGLHPTVCDLLRTWMSMQARANISGALRTGVLQGAPISPLLCNMYLHQMDVQLTSRRHKLIRYADDFVLLCASLENHLPLRWVRIETFQLQS